MPRRILHDQYFKQAKAEGYLARSAYKLKQIQESKRLLRRADRVLDLGCAPGAWMQVALELVGPKGVVVGLDLQEVRHSFGDNAFTIVGDVMAADPQVLRGTSGNLFDVVLSDMAPNTTGHNDDLVSARLCTRVLDLIPDLLKPGGNFAMKILEGGEYPGLLRRAGGMFDTCKGYKPAASREVSREMYIIGLSFRPPARH